MPHLTQYVLKAVVDPLIYNTLATMHFPDITGTFNAPLGLAGYRISHVRVQQFDMGVRKVSLTDDGIHVTHKQGFVELLVNWEYHVALVHQSGTATVHAANDIDALAHPASIVDGYPAYKFTHFNLNLHSVTVNVRGGAGWFYNTFLHVLSPIVKNTFASAFAKEVPPVILAEIVTLEHNIPKSANFHGLDVMFGQTELPFFMSDEASAPLTGEICLNSTTCCPITPTPLPRSNAVTAPASDYSAGIGYNLFECIGWAAKSSGFFDFSITNGTMPSQIPISLVTDDWAMNVPALEQYPGELMKVDLSMYSVPTVSDGLTMSVEVLLSVALDRPTPLWLGDMVLQSVVKLTPSVKSGSIVGQFAPVHDSLRLIGTSLRPTPDVTDLQTMAGWVVDGGIIPAIDQYLSRGIELPVVDHLRLKDSESVVLHDDERFLVVGVGMEYSR